MPTLSCPSCGKRYRLKGEPEGKTLRCPRCEAELEPEAAAAGVPLRQRLQHELARLSAAPAAGDAEETGRARVRVVEPRRPRARRWLLWGALAVAAACAVTAGWWVYARAHRRPLELPPEVKAAVAKARRTDVPGAEEQALADWRSARGMIMVHRLQSRTPDAFQEEIRGIEDRIRQLQEAIRRRREEDLRAGPGVGPSTGSPPPTPLAAASPLPASPEAEAAAGPVNRPAGSLRQRSAAGEPELMVDEPGGVLRWRAEAWANPLSVELEQPPDGRGRAVTIRQRPGGTDKWAVSMDQPLDVRAYRMLAVEVQSGEPVSLSAAVWTGPGNAMYESPAQTVAGGAWQEVSFGLTGRRFKSQATNWQFHAEIGNPESVMRITLLIYSSVSGPVRIRNVRLLKGD